MFTVAFYDTHHSLGPLNECDHCVFQVFVFRRCISEEEDLRIERA